MNSIDQSRLLQMRSSIIGQNSALQRATGGAIEGAAQTQGTSGQVDFGATLNDALKAVNAQQSKATEMTNAYERGETHDIVSVMVERQKASLGFEATLQVRNKLLSAYRDIMNMPV
jgi:flagellar hook-basal body complex protein FliE